MSETGLQRERGDVVPLLLRTKDTGGPLYNERGAIPCILTKTPACLEMVWKKLHGAPTRGRSSVIIDRFA